MTENSATPVPEPTLAEQFVKTFATGTIAAVKQGVHSTFFQKVLICAFAGFLAASLVEWAKVFVEGADDALNKGYKHRAVFDPGK
jgi:hypothetical protein